MRPSPHICLALIFLLALLLRASTLGAKSLWLDEGFSVAMAALPETAGLANVDSGHPPLYYILLHHWTRTFGFGEASVRAPSLLASLAGILLLYALAHRLFGPEVALLAAALLALSPLDTWYAQEARMAIFVTATALLAALGLALAGWRGALLMALGLGIGLYVDYTAALIWVGLSAAWLGIWWRRGRPPMALAWWLLGSLAGWLLYLPWWPAFVNFMEGVVSDVFVVEQARLTLGLPPLTVVHLLLLLVVVACATSLATLLMLPWLTDQRSRHTLTLLLVLLFALATLLTPVPRLFSVKRLVVTGWPFVILAVVWLVQQLPHHRTFARRSLLSISLAATLLNLFLVPKDDWRGVAAYLQQRQRPQELVWLDPAHNRYVYNYYRTDRPFTHFQQPRLAETADSADGVWFIALRFPGWPVAASETWLDQNWRLVRALPFYRLELRYYQR